MDKEDLKITPNNKNRFHITNSKGEVIDDANGFGFKTRKSASKALWYKFKNGKEKIKKEKSDLDKLLEKENYKKMKEEIENTMEWNFKDLGMGIITIEDIFDSVEKEFDEKIPYLLRKYFK